MTEVPASCFPNSKKLTTINFGSHIKTIQVNAFSNCTALERVTIGTGISVLRTKAFDGCVNLRSVVIPNGANLTTIEGHCFNNTNLTLFEPMNTSEYVFENGALLNGEKSQLIYYISNPKVKSYVIPGSVKELCAHSFMGAQYLMEIIVSDGNLIRIGYQTFQDCIRLRRLVLPDSLEVIDKEAFRNCDRIVCGGLVLNEKFVRIAKDYGMPELALSDGCLNNFDALLRRKTCIVKKQNRVYSLYAIILGSVKST